MATTSLRQATMFSTHLNRIAIVGAGGQVGTHITQSLLKTGNHTVTALTRLDSTSTLPDGVKTALIDYNNESTIVEALRDQQFLIITLANRFASEAQPKLIRAAAKSGVAYIMPNWYGLDLANEKFASELLIATAAQAAIKQIQEAGLKSIVLACGYWYEFSLAGGTDGRGGGTERFGFDLENHRLELIDDGKQKINTSTLEQCGRAVASLLSLPVEREKGAPDKTALSDWNNGIVYCSSFSVNQLDMFESVKTATKTTDADWTITRENSRVRYDKGVKAWKGDGEAKGIIRAGYTRVFFPDGAGNFSQTRGLDNDALGLPQEDFDECTARAVRGEEA